MMPVGQWLWGKREETAGDVSARKSTTSARTKIAALRPGHRAPYSPGSDGRRSGCGIVVTEGDQRAKNIDGPYDARRPWESQCASGWTERKSPKPQNTRASVIASPRPRRGGQWQQLVQPNPLWAPSAGPEATAGRTPKGWKGRQLKR